MTVMWGIRIGILFVLHFATSFALIYNKKKEYSYCIEIILTLLAMLWSFYYSRFFFDKVLEIKILRIFFSKISYEYLLYNIYCRKEYIWLFIVEYVIFKIVLLIVIWELRYFSFYAIISETKKNGLIAKIGYRIFGKTKFIKFTSKMWNGVNYGIRIKRGIPGMVNKKHKASGVQFDKYGFPKFKAIATVKLPRKYYKKTREVHFYQANKLLYEKCLKSKKSSELFTDNDLILLENEKNPVGYTWHHHQDRGVMQLVKTEIHEKVGHKGGYTIWGKGN